MNLDYSRLLTTLDSWWLLTVDVESEPAYTPSCWQCRHCRQILKSAHTWVQASVICRQSQNLPIPLAAGSAGRAGKFWWLLTTFYSWLLSTLDNSWWLLTLDSWWLLTLDDSWLLMTLGSWWYLALDDTWLLMTLDSWQLLTLDDSWWLLTTLDSLCLLGLLTSLGLLMALLTTIDVSWQLFTTLDDSGRLLSLDDSW